MSGVVDIRRGEYLVWWIFYFTHGVVDVWCGGGLCLPIVWWISGVVDVWCGGGPVWWMSYFTYGVVDVGVVYLISFVFILYLCENKFCFLQSPFWSRSIIGVGEVNFVSWAKIFLGGLGGTLNNCFLFCGWSCFNQWWEECSSTYRTTSKGTLETCVPHQYFCLFAAAPPICTIVLLPW